MDPALPPFVSNQSAASVDVGRHWHRFRPFPLLGGVALSWMVLISVWLSIRRLAGGPQRPLTSVELLVCVVGAIGLALAIVEAFRQGKLLRTRSIARGTILTLLAMALLLTTASISSLPKTSHVGVVLTWMLTTAGVWLLVARMRSTRTPIGFERSPNSTTPVGQGEPNQRMDPAIEFDETGQMELLPPDLDQRISIGRDPSDRPCLHGQARVLLPADHRQLHYHLAICPPWDHAPDVQVEVMDGPDVEVSVGLAVPHGIRLDIRRAEPIDTDASVVIEFFGQ